MPVLDRMRKAWNAFRNTNTDVNSELQYSTSSWGGASPSRTRLQFYSERSIVSSIYTRIAIDVSDLVIRHIKTDKDGRYLNDIQSSLNECLTLEPNLDQAPRAFRQDIAMTLFDKGVVAIVPVDTTRIQKLMKLLTFIHFVLEKLLLGIQNMFELTFTMKNKGKREEIAWKNDYVAIIENPLYAVMNEPNSTLQRLIRKLNLA